MNIIGETFLKELLLESAITRKYLEAVQFDNKGYSPTNKSEEIIRLAVHVAEITSWWSSLVNSDRLDFEHFEPENITSNKELLDYFDDLLNKAKQDLLSVSDVEFEKNWSMTYGEQILFTLPKREVARVFCMNHIIHHRAQLGVYLRLLGVAVPASYGPSADDEDVMLTKGFM